MFGVLCVCLSFVSCIIAMCILCSCRKCFNSLCFFCIPSMFSCSMFMFRRSFLGMFVFLCLLWGSVWGLAGFPGGVGVGFGEGV